MSAFTAGDRVAWSHEEATKHAEGSILKASVLGEPGEGPGEGQLGTIVGPANEQGSLWDVLLDGDDDARTLTADELVRVAEDQ